MPVVENEFATLLQRLRDGSEAAANELVEKYGHHVLKIVRRRLNDDLRAKFDSQDFTQTVWATFFKNREQIAAFDSPEGLIKFLVSVANNKVVHEVRRYLQAEIRNVNSEESLETAPLEDEDLHCPHQPTPSRQLSAKEQWEKMSRDQPPHYVEMLNLRSDGCTYAEIARKVNVDERTVRRVIKRLLERLDP